MMANPNESSRQAALQAPRSLFALWVEMIGPPLIWFAQFQVKYVLAGKSVAQRHPGLLIGTTVVAASLVIFLAYGAWQHRRIAAASPLDAAAGVIERNRFMAAIGLLNAALFLVVIVAQGAAEFFFEPTE